MMSLSTTFLPRAPGSYLSVAFERGSRRCRAPRPAVRPAAALRRQEERSRDEAPTSAGVELTKWELAASSLAGAFLLPVDNAMAQGGDFGLLEGRSFALLHPIGMATLFASTVYAGYLGFQWRRLREVGAEISTRKKELPPVGDDGTRPSSPLDAEISKLEAERKTLAAGDFKNKHNNMGSLLLGMGVLLSVEGGLNTYLRVGKLFPGPHLFAGAGITVLWALAAALVPAMQKGNETARSAHIALNTINLALFCWQVREAVRIADSYMINGIGHPCLSVLTGRKSSETSGYEEAPVSTARDIA